MNLEETYNIAGVKKSAALINVQTELPLCSFQACKVSN